MQGGDDIRPGPHRAVLDTLEQVVPDQVAGGGLDREPSPQLRRLDVGAVPGLLRPRPRRIIRPTPAVFGVEGVAERAERLFPARRRDVEAPAALQVAARGEDVHMSAAVQLAVHHGRPGVAVGLEPGPGRPLKVIQNRADLRVGRRVVRRPGDHARRVLVLERQRVGHRGHLMGIPPEDLDARAQLPGRVPRPEEVVGRRPGRAGAVSQEFNEHRSRGARRGPAPRAPARWRPGGRRPRRPRLSRRRCWPSGRSGSGCCRCARSAGCARAQPRPPGRSTSADAALARQSASSAGDTRAAAVTVRRSAISAPAGGFGGLAPRPRTPPERGPPGDRRGGGAPPSPASNVAHWVCWLTCLTGLPRAEQTGFRASRAPSKPVRRRVGPWVVRISIPYIQEAAFGPVNRGKREDVPRGPATYRSPARLRHRTLEPPPEGRWNQRVASVTMGSSSDRRRSGAAVQPSLWGRLFSAAEAAADQRTGPTSGSRRSPAR